VRREAKRHAALDSAERTGPKSGVLPAIHAREIQSAVAAALCRRTPSASRSRARVFGAAYQGSRDSMIGQVHGKLLSSDPKELL
jgi:hypothetical protein